MIVPVAADASRAAPPATQTTQREAQAAPLRDDAARGRAAARTTPERASEVHAN